MSETEKQEGQKTVVAFIAGLLIGGLLVWVFSSAPEKEVVDTLKDNDTEATSTDDRTPVTTKTTADKVVATPGATPNASTATAGDARLTVVNQKAGTSVALGNTTYPSNAGWIVVRDYVNGVAGKVLGAARFNTADGLTPTSVPLLRSTVAGSTYQVVYFSDNGDKKFLTATDKVVEGVSASFKAE